MAIAYDATAKATATSATSLTFAHTCTGSNRILFVGFSAYSPASISSVTYNSVAMTQVATVTDPIGTKYYIFYLVAPSTGANNIVITASGSCTLRAISASYTGAAQTSPIDSSGTNQNENSATLAVSTTVVASTCWLAGFGGCQTQSTSGTEATGRTDRNTYGANDPSNIFQSDVWFDSNTTIATGSQSTTFTTTSGGGPTFLRKGGIAFSFKEYSAAGPANLKTYNTNPLANIKSINTNLIANVKSLNTNI